MHHTTPSRSPHNALHSPSYLFIYIYIWYVRIPYMHSALFVRDAIFPHCTLNHCLLKRQDYRKVEQWESTQQGLENGEEREALLARPRLIIDGVLRDSGCTKFTQLLVVTSQFVMFISCAMRARIEAGTGSRHVNWTPGCSVLSPL